MDLDVSPNKEFAMDDMTPPLLHAIREIRWSLSTGISTKESVAGYLANTHDSLSAQIRHAWIAHQQGVEPPRFATFRSQALWHLIERGLNGQPIHEALHTLEHDVESAAIDLLDGHLARLPLKILLPLLFLQFPAYLLILLGPVLREISTQMGG